ncbi:DUF998 domain-containing protein [Cryptosporangium minutisporangium]|uniref:DUF998 domain-containing protein n=1 Tax=Cryptosporangium minutisporangium TaxID=113569 RepID=A0ABP6T5F8_9ACTN
MSTNTTATDRISARLLAAGAAAGPLYVVVSLVEVVTREGFDPTRHAWSMLANGGPGWIHRTNLIVSGVLVILGAVGLSRALRSRWAPALLGLYGLGMVGGGIFAADPGRGFPVGTPEVVPVSASGALHFVCGGIGFVGLIAACFVLARRLRAEDHRRLATFSRVTGVAFAVGFVVMGATGGQAWSLLAFTAAVILASAWLTTVFLHYSKNN